MADRLLQHKPTGVMYIWQEVFANHADFEEIIDVESKVVSEPPKRPKLGLPTKAASDAVLGAEAARGLP